MARPDITRQEWAERTEHARRLARFKHALDRCRQIADGSPAFTEKEMAELAAVFAPAAAETPDGGPAFTGKELKDLAGVFSGGGGEEDAA